MKSWIDRIWQRDDWVRRAFDQALESFALESAGKRRNRQPKAQAGEADRPSGVLRADPISLDTLG